MFKKWSLVLVFVLIAALALAACGGDDDKDGDNGDSGSSVNLPDSYTGETTGISVSYPDGWAATEEAGFGVIVANSADGLAAQELGDTDRGVTIMVQSLADLGAEDLDSAFTTLTTAMIGESDTTEAGDVQDISVGGHDAKRIDATDSSNDSALTSIGFLSDDGSQLILVSGVTKQANMDDFEPQLLAIAGSVSFTAPTTE